MPKVKFYNFPEGPCNITYYPELGTMSQMTSLFKELGVVEKVKPHHVMEAWFRVTIRLHKPAIVHDWHNPRHDIHSVSINGDTFKVMRYPACVDPLPKFGDEVVHITVEAEQDDRFAFDGPVETHNIDVIRQRIREMAKGFAEHGFRYHFKGTYYKYNKPHRDDKYVAPNRFDER